MEAAFVQGLLQNAGVPAVVMNQSDSSYKFGDVKVMVPPEKEREAASIVKDYLQNRN